MNRILFNSVRTWFATPLRYFNKSFLFPQPYLAGTLSSPGHFETTIPSESCSPRANIFCSLPQPVLFNSSHGITDRRWVLFPCHLAELGIFVTDSSTVYVVTSTIRKHNRRHIVKKCHFVCDSTTIQDTNQPYPEWGWLKGY